MGWEVKLRNFLEILYDVKFTKNIQFYFQMTSSQTKHGKIIIKITNSSYLIYPTYLNNSWLALNRIKIKKATTHARINKRNPLG